MDLFSGREDKMKDRKRSFFFRALSLEYCLHHLGYFLLYDDSRFAGWAGLKLNTINDAPLPPWILDAFRLPCAEASEQWRARLLLCSQRVYFHFFLPRPPTTAKVKQDTPPTLPPAPVAADHLCTCGPLPVTLWKKKTSDWVETATRASYFWSNKETDVSFGNFSSCNKIMSECFW